MRRRLANRHADGNDAAQRLLTAWQARDAAALAAALHRRVSLTAEGVEALVDPVRGAAAVAATLLHLDAGPGRLTLTEATGMPAILLRTAEGRVRAVVVVESRRHLVIRLWAVFNPAKLTTWT
ncbi:hypothetical protein ET475_08970 [Microbacterium protaetiae]|uniref:RNA polymerase subunit sigma n=1 Tax=Microbacterium protaetiae TaxID=2509458 RepID=A0A4P6EQB0_9MICO|nr:hypothetical protein [Microbacterium protaetiae]QAY60108.1 hypothetical protein ET475_08970 [Microbacterium protaetiae]